ncbi:MAG TPA: hypothetical protein VGQ83_33685 [Polyangia bacterium]|jgi:hypothetical protein
MGVTVSRPSVRLALVAALLGWAAGAAAQPAARAAAAAENTVAAGLVLAYPAALPTGLMTGVGAAFTRSAGRFGWGASASWGTATEYTLTETVRNDDLRLRVHGVAQRGLGRGTVGLRLGLGGTLVYEARERAQGGRAGLAGTALSSSVWALLPGADLEVVATLRLLDAWALTVSGGPSVHLLDGSPRGGWRAGLGVAWQR